VFNNFAGSEGKKIMSATNRSVGPVKAILVMPLEQDIPGLANVFLVRAGLDLPIPLRAGQV